MRVSDTVSGTVLVLFALAEIAWTRTFPTLHGQAYGPSLFPVLIGAGLIACGVLLIARGVAARRRAPERASGPERDDRLGGARGRADFALIVAAVLAYILLSTPIGFVPLSIAILTLLLVRFGSSAALAITVALVTTGGLQVLFARVLLVPLPPGLLRGLLW